MSIKVSFYYADYLINAKTGQEDDYYFETKDNVYYNTNYIVKLEDEEYGTIKYDLFPLGYQITEPEPMVTLYDYMYWIMVRDAGKEYDETYFCPDTGECFVFQEFKKRIFDELYGCLNDEGEKND